RYEPSPPVHRSASPQLRREAVTSALPRSSARKRWVAVPQPMPGRQPGLALTLGSPSGLRTDGFELPSNLQYVLSSRTVRRPPARIRTVRPLSAGPTVIEDAAVAGWPPRRPPGQAATVTAQIASASTARTAHEAS